MHAKKSPLLWSFLPANDGPLHWPGAEAVPRPDFPLMNQRSSKGMQQNIRLMHIRCIGDGIALIACNFRNLRLQVAYHRRGNNSVFYRQINEVLINGTRFEPEAPNPHHWLIPYDQLTNHADGALCRLDVLLDE